MKLPVKRFHHPLILVILSLPVFVLGVSHTVPVRWHWSYCLRLTFTKVLVWLFWNIRSEFCPSFHLAWCNLPPAPQDTCSHHPWHPECLDHLVALFLLYFSLRLAVVWLLHTFRSRIASSPKTRTVYTSASISWSFSPYSLTSSMNSKWFIFRCPSSSISCVVLS